MENRRERERVREIERRERIAGKRVQQVLPRHAARRRTIRRRREEEKKNEKENGRVRFGFVS